MGGKNCVIVDADADLDDAVPALAYRAFGFAGQKCSAAARALVHERIADSAARAPPRRRRALLIDQAERFGVDVPPVIEPPPRSASKASCDRPRAGRPRPPARPGPAARLLRGARRDRRPPARVARRRGGDLRPGARRQRARRSRRRARSSNHPSPSPAACSPATPATVERVAGRSRRQPLRQPRDHRRHGRPPAVRRQPPVAAPAPRPAAPTTCCSSSSRGW